MIPISDEKLRLASVNSLGDLAADAVYHVRELFVELQDQAVALAVQFPVAHRGEEEFGDGGLGSGGLAAVGRADGVGGEDDVAGAGAAHYIYIAGVL